VLKEHCAAVGRDFNELEVSWAGSALITESTEVKDEMVRRMAEAFGAPPEQVAPGMLVGSVEEVRDRIATYIDAGVTHFITIMNAPFDHDSIRRFAEEVIPSFRHDNVS
jgi:alkanesulfonate monooxygenase SsuD/methylene tetrahydromethanopterin reductase-like flavin-dependent oxidoreductase (luciferase family)